MLSQEIGMDERALRMRGRGVDAAIEDDFISDISWKYLSTYFTGDESLYRHYQRLFLSKYGAEVTGKVVELGGEKKYQNRIYFPNATEYVVTNIQGDVDLVLDITCMNCFEDETQDAYVCTSVLEHVFDIREAIYEMRRTLRKGGVLLMTVPFMYPYHDVVDYWRMSRDSYLSLFGDFEIHSITRLGGTISSVVNLLQRPKRKLTPRYTIYKSAGLLVGAVARRLDSRDSSPIGYGLYATKR